MRKQHRRLGCAALAGLALAGVISVGCGDGGEKKAVGSGSSSDIVSGGGGKGVTYEIRGPVRRVVDCGVGKGPKPGTKERATTSLKLTGRKFTAAVGAASDLPSRYASYTGVLRADGSFHLESDYSSPGNIATAVLDGSFTRSGSVEGIWRFGLPGTLPNNLNDPNCRIFVGPLSSSFYFGVKRVDWREAFGVT